MNLTLRIPDEIAARLGAPGLDLGRQALEALVAESFRAGRLSKDELAQVLALDGGDQIDGFLKAHDVFEPCTVEDINRDVATLARLGY
jgi:hypothetical protein